MQKEQISDKEAICLIIEFIFGSSLIIGVGGDAKNDAWLAGIAGLIMALPMLFIYIRIISLFQGKDLFDILSLTLGKVAGKIVSFIYIWYALHLGALVIRNFGEFVNTVAMPETPMSIPMLFLGIVCIIGVRFGIEVISRINTYFIPAILFVLILVQIFSIPKLHLNYLKPILGDGLMPVLKGGFSAFSFPFAETVLFIGIFSSLQTKKSPRKVFFWGILLSFTVILVTTIRNISVLGSMLGNFYFPSYAVVSRINIGDFLERIEVTVAIVFVFSVFIKISICLLVTCKGIGKLFNLSNYRSVAINTGLLMTYLAYFIYDDTMLMKYWAFKVYKYYAFPMQVILPVVIWIFAEVKSKRSNSEASKVSTS